MKYLTPLGLLNFLFLQWFFIRLARVSPYHGCFITLVDHHGQETTHMVVDYDQKKHLVTVGEQISRRYVVLYWILPLTGWWSKYRGLKRNW